MELQPRHGGYVIGLGIDLIDCARVRGVWERQGTAFLQKVFTPAEQAYCLAKHDPAPYLAARFAAKEAVAKAFGTGIGAEVGWLSVGIVHDERGAPQVVLDAGARDFLHRLGGETVQISLTHTDHLAQAVALLLAASAPVAAISKPLP